MKKTPTIFKRDPDNRRLVLDKPSGPDVMWVFEGEGVATRKLDGTACLAKDGKLYKRYELKPGRVAPADFMPASSVDPNTGKQPGWVPIGDGPEDKYHREALERHRGLMMPLHDGTYELVGKKINGDKDGFGTPHRLVAHDSCEVLYGDDTFLADPLTVIVVADIPRTFEAIKHYLEHHHIEGIVWHHPDGRWAKIKRRDFGLQW